ncbi:MAG: ABC transporter ATP-binding protein [Oligoflexia bacterium]|nr:ABC transporter ATP-binding protein [Oligoflexia bacterium]
MMKISKFKRIWSFLEGHSRTLIVACILVLISTTVTAVMPLAFREILDKGIPSRHLPTILWMSFGYLLLIVIHEGVHYFISLSLGKVGIKVVNNIKAKLLTHIATLSIDFYDRLGTGKLISLIESDTQKLFMLFSNSMVMIIWGVLNLLVSIGVMLFTSWKLTILVLMIAPVYTVGTYWIFSRLRPRYKRDRELYAKISGHLGEHLKAISLLKNLNNLDWSRDKFLQLNEDKRRYETTTFLREAVVWFFLMLAPQMAIAGILYLSVGWIRDQQISFGTVWMFIQYVQSAIGPVMMISEQVGEVQRSFGAADRIFDALDTKSSVPDGSIACENFHFQKSIIFENVCFRYMKDQQQVLNRVSFELPKGKMLAIVGPTGSGKSTIISLLSRFYDPTEGKITVDEVDLRTLSLDALRSKIGLILQDIFLFPGTVVENLRALRADISDEEALTAAEQMDILGIIAKFPHGAYSELSEGGKNLSFGERQLLSFARALTFDPEILILDEATSAVDPQTEARIQQSLKKLLAGRTSIVIAHRLSTIIHADKIIVLREGKIIEEGTHQTLLAHKGHYAHLYHTQMKSQQC